MIDVRAFLNDPQLELIALRDCPDSWGHVYQNLPYRSVSYSPYSMKYQLAYHEGFGGRWQDVSCVLLSGGEPVGIWPLTATYGPNYEGVTNLIHLSSQGNPVRQPLFLAKCPRSTAKKITKKCFNVATKIAFQAGMQSWKSMAVCDGIGALPYWHRLSMANGAQCETRHDLYVDLSQPTDKIKSQFRKSYRGIVNVGEREWDVNIISSPGCEKVWDEFRNLHAQVAGRVTRSRESWDIQHDMIAADCAFLITLRDKGGQLVGGGFFVASDDEGSYAVGAYNRDLFDRPLGHAVQMHAIRELKGRGCKWYCLGERGYPGQTPKPTEKELNISHFKEGFSTHVFPRFELTHTT